MLELWHIWIIAGIILWIIEIFTPGFVLGVFGTACFMAAPFAGADVTFKMQLLVFGVATGVMTVAIRPIIIRHFYGREPKVRTNIDALIGKSCIVTEVIDHLSGTGTVKIGGEIWSAYTPDESRVDVGQKVTVRKVIGCKVVVEQTTTTKGGAEW